MLQYHHSLSCHKCSAKRTLFKRLAVREDKYLATVWKLVGSRRRRGDVYGGTPLTLPVDISVRATQSRPSAAAAAAAANTTPPPALVYTHILAPPLTTNEDRRYPPKNSTGRLNDLTTARSLLGQALLLKTRLRTTFLQTQTRHKRHSTSKNSS